MTKFSFITGQTLKVSEQASNSENFLQGFPLFSTNFCKTTDIYTPLLACSATQLSLTFMDGYESPMGFPWWLRVKKSPLE